MLKTALVVVIIAAIFGGILMQANGFTDPYYLKFTSPRQGSLILGTSRAHQGIRPDVLKEKLGTDIYNYAFNIGTSPYGPAYLRAIERKLDTSGTDGIFILGVDPYTISESRDHLMDTAKFREVGRFLNMIENPNTSPNLEYLKHEMGGRYYRIFLRESSKMELKEDGWLKLDINVNPKSVAKRVANKVKQYQKYVETYAHSPVRIDYLERTIDLLKKYGKVYLVRLPVSPQLMKIDEQICPDFDRLIGPSVTSSDGYLDLWYLNDAATFTDGNHLHYQSAGDVTAAIADWIAGQPR